MKVQSLDFVEYTNNGLRSQRHEIANPSWPQIEHAIRTMDQFCFPMVFLRLDAQTHEDLYLGIVGGDGVYAMEYKLEDEPYHQYYDASKSDEEVAVWTSDQGYEPEEHYVCYDVEVVLRVAQHFADQGTADPGVTWT